MFEKIVVCSTQHLQTPSTSRKKKKQKRDRTV